MQTFLTRPPDPQANATFAIVAVALSMMVFAYSTRFGPASILAFYALWLPLLLRRPRILLEGAHRVAVLLIVPTLAALSVLWSDVPSATLRGAIQYGSTVVCGLIAARVVPMPTLAAGGLAGGALVLVWSALDGGHAYNAIDGSYAFTGAFGSKNQLGYFCSLTLLFCAAVLLLYRARAAWNCAALAVGALALTLLALSDSATSVLSLLFAVAVLALAVGLALLPPYLRRAAILALLFGACAVAAAAVNAGAFDAVLAAFGKDSTLTGRTYLWQEGIAQGNENPLLGLGYLAFWVAGRPRAEDLWDTFYITGKTGFHFHNTLIEAYVALGIVGVAMIAALTAALAILAVLTVLRSTAVASSALCAALAFLFVLRSGVEIDFFTPYTAGSFLVPFVLLNMADRHAADGRILARLRPDRPGAGGQRAAFKRNTTSGQATT